MRTTISRIGKYELKAVLARTPMSTVYDGWDSDIARRVAIKLMPLASVDSSETGEAFARFKRGARAAGQLNHPNIVSVYDYGETDEYAYLVMEFVDGPTLKALLDANERFALPEICRIIGSVLEALQYSHDRGVVHRDVKPANIMFTANKQVKITDFGIARLEDSEMTQAGMVIGTPAYMSPEQFLGEKIDWRTDIYSTGVVLYHMLTGERPYEGSLTTIMHKVLYGSLLPPSRVSTLVTPVLDTVVTRAMARNPSDRFNSAAEFNVALQAGRSPARPRPERLAVGTGMSGDQPRPIAADSSRSSVGVPVFIALTTCVLAAVGWFVLMQPTTPSPVDPVLARANQEQARLQQEQEEARLQQEQDQARRDLDQEQARLQQEQEQARLQQQQQDDARLQQGQEQARLQQEQQARLRQAMEQAQARQKQEQIRQAQEQARQRQEQEQARLKPAQEQVRQKQAQEPPHPKQESDGVLALGVPPPVYPVTSTNGAAGIVCQSVTAETAGQFGMDSPQGMVVTGVLAGGAADKAGIREHDVILKIKGSEAHDLSILSRIAAENPSGQSVPVDLLHNGGHRVVQLTLEQVHR